jgi:acetyl-CoA carboxylase biotin carboxyl carrier protein
MKKDINTISEIIEIIGNSKLTEINIEEENFKLSIKKPKLVVSTPILDNSKKVSTKPNKSKDKKNDNENVKEIKSSSVGRFFYIDRDELPMITLGKKVKKGQKIGYIKALGIDTPIKSEFDGKIKAILVENGEIAEYGKVLVQIKI